MGYVVLFLTLAPHSVGIAISCESVFALAPIALDLWYSYELRRLIPCASIVRAFDDRLIQFSFTFNACRVRSCMIYNHWKCPCDLDSIQPIVEVRVFGMEKSGIIVGTLAFFSFCIVGIVAVVCRVDSINECGYPRQAGVMQHNMCDCHNRHYSDYRVTELRNHRQPRGRRGL